MISFFNRIFLIQETSFSKILSHPYPKKQRDCTKKESKYSSQWVMPDMTLTNKSLAKFR
jgi:hypothetical protein